MTRKPRLLFLSVVAGGLLGGSVVAGEAQPSTEPAELVVTAPLGGARGRSDQLPAVAYSLETQDLGAGAGFSVHEALGRAAPGVTISDVQGSRLTQDVEFHGFRASPLQGAAQGLAVYQNAVRLNEAFGDTVNWDLLPQVAVRRVDLVTGDPVFGLNAIGGALAVQMKDGFSTEGGSATLQGGSFGAVRGSLEQTTRWGDWSLYLAGDAERDDGWRLHSPSRAARLYGDLGWRGGHTEAHLTVSAGADRFGVVGPTPVDLLQADPAAVYTYPQITGNRALLVTFATHTALSSGWSLDASLYGRRFDQTHTDGNDGDFVPCRGLPPSGGARTLCVDDEGLALSDVPPASLQLLGPSGEPIPCPSKSRSAGDCSEIPYGTVDRTHTRTATVGLSVQVGREAKVLGRRNSVLVGSSVDVSKVRFSAASRLGVIQPSLEVTTSTDVPGSGEIIHTAGALAYSPVELADRTTYVGLYGRDTLELTHRLSLTLSARFNSAWIRLKDLTGENPDLDGQHRFNRFNPAAGLAYGLGRGVSLFGGYAEANRAPTPLELGCSDPLKPCLLEGALVADPPLKQVTARTWQAGVGGRQEMAGAYATWSASVFSTISEDDILALASPIQGRGYFANVPRTRRRGFDLAAQLTAPRWSAYASYSRIEATYGFEGLLASPNNPSADAQGDILVRPGDHIGGIPSGVLKIGGDASVTQAVGIGFDLTVTGGQFLVGDEANAERKLGAYGLVGLHATLQVEPGVQIFARVDNLFDSAAASYGSFFETDALASLSPSPLPADPDPRTLTPLTPRAIEIGVTARW